MGRWGRAAICWLLVAVAVPACSAVPFGRCDLDVADRSLPPGGDRRSESLLLAGVKPGGVVLYEARAGGDASRVAVLADDELGGPADRTRLVVDGARPYVVSGGGRVLAVNPVSGHTSPIAELGSLDHPSVAVRSGALFVADGARLFQVGLPSGLPVVVTGLPGSAIGPAGVVPEGVATLVRQGDRASVAVVPAGSRSPARTVALPGSADDWTALVAGVDGTLVAGGPGGVARVVSPAASSLPVFGTEGAAGPTVVGSPGAHLARVGERVWSGGPDGRVDRLDAGLEVASSTTVQCADASAPVPVAGAGSVWAAVDRDDVVARIDPDTGRLLGRLALPLAKGGGSRYRVVGGTTTAWVADEATGAVYELDPVAGAARHVALPGPPDGVVGAVVVSLPDG